MLKFILILWLPTSYVGSNGSSVEGAQAVIAGQFDTVEQCLAAGREHPRVTFTCSLGERAQ
jgi:hypothetical protein